MNMNKTSEISHAAGISDKAIKNLNLLRFECITLMGFLAEYEITNIKLANFPKYSLNRGKATPDDFAVAMMQYNLIVLKQALILLDEATRLGITYTKYTNEHSTGKKGYTVTNVCRLRYLGEDVIVENVDYTAYVTEMLSHTRYILETERLKNV